MGHLGWLYKLNLHPRHQHCTDEAQKAETVLSAVNEGVVSKETVVLRRWGSSIHKFGFINGVDNVNWPPYLCTVANLHYQLR